jgi:hypothetical protein
MPADLCRVCDHPREGHGRRYAALVGLHEWAPDDMPRLDDIPVPTSPRWCPCGPGETCAWCTRSRPANDRVPIPHPAGGVTYPTDPHDPAGDRLFYRRATA